MKANEIIKKQEAIERMKRLGLFKPCIDAFEERNELQFSEVTGGLYEFSSNEKLTNKVKEFEKEYDALVYHVIHSVTNFGELYSFLYVSDDTDDWEYDRDDIENKTPLAYVWNVTYEDFSEIGSIQVAGRFGGLVRTA